MGQTHRFHGLAVKNRLHSDSGRPTKTGENGFGDDLILGAVKHDRGLTLAADEPTEAPHDEEPAAKRRRKRMKPKHVSGKPGVDVKMTVMTDRYPRRRSDRPPMVPPPFNHHDGQACQGEPAPVLEVGSFLRRGRDFRKFANLKRISRPNIALLRV